MITQLPSQRQPPTSPRPPPHKVLLRLGIAITLLLALWLRQPFIGEGMPFFYREDEAHHFNRLTEMVKEGRLDPQYFHKPSLHFYARMPVVAASFFWTVRQGNIRSIQEVVTRDPYGIGDYSFHASHPGIVKWNRGFSVMLILATLFLATLIAFQISRSTTAAGLTAASIAVLPPLVTEGAIIGVDVLMTFMCVLCVWYTLRTHDRFSVAGLLLSSLLAGLAVSSKYNAAPVVVVPLLLLILRNEDKESRLSARSVAAWASGCTIGFLCGTPFLFAHIPLFLDQVAYEVWHYGVAGHVGNMTEPGLSQLLFYFRWMNFEALGPVLTIMTAGGTIGLLCFNRSRHLLLLCFPVLFFALMVMQKTNFTRNMLVVLPFFAVVSSLFIVWVLSRLHVEGRTRALIIVAYLAVGLGYPLRVSLTERAAALEAPESRLTLMETLAAEMTQATSPRRQVAISGQLQLPVSFLTSGPYRRFDQTSDSLLSWYLLGFDAFAVSAAQPLAASDQALFPIERSIEGRPEKQRIVRNPTIDLRVPGSSPASSQPSSQALREAARELAKKTAAFSLDVTLGNPAAKNCQAPGRQHPANSSEDYCWLVSRASIVHLTDLASTLRADRSSAFITLSLDMMTPWSDNPVTLSQGDWSHTVTLPPSQWSTITVQVPLKELLADPRIIIEATRVLSPRLQGLSSDERALAVAIRNVRLV